MNMFLYLDSDTTIYRHKSISNLNTGYDEILELENTFSEESGHHLSRIILDFNIGQSSIQSLLNTSEFFLHLNVTDTEELTTQTELEVLPIKSMWQEGVGRRFDNIEPSGATWLTTNGMQKWNSPGCDFYTIQELETLYGITKIPTYKFDKRTSDVIFDVTEYVELWISGHIDNNGLLVKFKNETTSYAGKINFFAKDTNTIYQPYLRIANNDYIFDPCECNTIESVKCIYNGDDINIISGSDNINQISGSGVNTISGSDNINQISGSDSNHISGSLCDTEPTLAYQVTSQKPNIKFIHHDNISVSISGIKAENSVREQHRIKVNVRDKFPIKSFSNRSRYLDVNFVDHPMYYSVIDADTKERVLGYDKYTRISCNGHGHYFDFDFGCLSIDRIYYFEIRVESSNQIKIHEDIVRFKVIR